jgi:hypothetical protein
MGSTLATLAAGIHAATSPVPEKSSLDNGYSSGKNLQEVWDREVEAYVATNRGTGAEAPFEKVYSR